MKAKKKWERGDEKEETLSWEKTFIPTTWTAAFPEQEIVKVEKTAASGFVHLRQVSGKTLKAARAAVKEAGVRKKIRI